MPHEPANTSIAAQPTKFTGTVASRRRVSEDGGEYTYAEFVEFFGSEDGAKRWLSAERRFSFDCYAYTYAEFVEFFGTVLLFPKMLHPTRLAHRPQQT